MNQKIKQDLVKIIKPPHQWEMMKHKNGKGLGMEDGAEKCNEVFTFEPTLPTLCDKNNLTLPEST